MEWWTVNAFSSGNDVSSVSDEQYHHDEKAHALKRNKRKHDNQSFKKQGNHMAKSWNVIVVAFLGPR